MSDDDKTATDEPTEDTAVEPTAEPDADTSTEPEEKTAEETTEEAPAEEAPAEDAPAPSAAAAEPAGTDQQGRTLYNVKCSNCGKDTQVPFQPSEGRPVYCRDCYMQKKNS